MRHHFLSLLALPLLGLSVVAELTFTSLPTCAHDCALEYASQMNCYLPTNALCMCGSIQQVSDAYQCTLDTCSSESQKTQKIVQDWFNMVCEPSSENSDLGSGYSTDSITGTPTAAASSVSQTGTAEATVSATAGAEKVPEKVPEKGGVGLGAIAGIAAAVVAIVGAVIGVWMWKRHSQPGVVPLPDNEGQWSSMPEVEGKEIQKPMPAAAEIDGRHMVFEAGSGKRDTMGPAELP